jgi:transposase
LLRERSKKLNGCSRGVRKGQLAIDLSRTPAAALLARLKAIGPQIAAVLDLEGFYRHFDNRREVAAYAGLVPTRHGASGRL